MGPILNQLCMKGLLRAFVSCFSFIYVYVGVGVGVSQYRSTRLLRPAVGQ